METLVARFFSELGLHKMDMLFNVISQLDDVEDIFTLLWDLEEAHSCLITPNICRKSDPDAEKARQEANVHYKSGRFFLACQGYNSSILLAPHPELDVDNMECKPLCSAKNLMKYKTLALGYANRSAIFLEWNKYEECLADIDMAFKYGYPKEMYKKLEERRERCLKAKASASKVNLDPVSISLNEKTPPKLLDPSLTIPSFSRAIKFAYSTERGRHVVATRDIPPGEVIAVEESNCSRIYENPDGVPYCPVCLLQCHRKIPCPSCCLVMFCSDTCRARGLEEHLKGCKIFTTINALSIEDDFVACLAVKLVVNTTFAKLKEMMPVLKKESKTLPPQELGFTDKGLYISSDYRSVYFMSTSQNKRPAQYVLRSCLLSFLMTKVLAQSEDFFVTKDGLPLKASREDYILAGTALLRQMILSSSIMAISDVKVKLKELGTEKKVIGSGIYPSLYLMRHSCNPPTLFYNFGHVKIVRTILPIAKDEEVTLALADRYMTTPVLLRKIQMASQGRVCSCEACVELWPAIPDIPKQINFKCIKCGGLVSMSDGNPICIACKFQYSLRASNGQKKNKNSVQRRFMAIVDEVIQGEKRFSRVNNKLSTGQRITKSDYEAVCKFAHLLKKHVKEPSMVFAHLRDIMLMLFYKD